jgi:hypothetical protein
MLLATLALFATTVAPAASIPAAPPASAPAAANPVETTRTAAAPPAFRALSCARGCLSAIEAVTYASYLGEKAGVAGMFEMPVVEVGQQNGLFYLNSEDDYRDRNCLTVAMTPAAMQAFIGTVDLDQVRKRLQKRRIVVRGVAQQVRINFSSDGRPSGKYYYQVHVRVGEASQVRLTV